MPAWPGGPCPNCGEDIPANIVSCRNCRQLLNSDLQRDSIHEPEFVPLTELSTRLEVEVRGMYVACPLCRNDLKIHLKHLGHKVQCKTCDGTFRLKKDMPQVLTGEYYCDCGHCGERLRFSRKYVDSTVSCKFCHGHLQILPLGVGTDPSLKSV